MKVITMQHKDFLNKVDDNGFIIPTHRNNSDVEIELGVWDDCYSWMDKQFSKRTGLPLDRDSIWVFYDRFFDYGYDIVDHKDYRVFVFEIPMENIKSNFLWSDYGYWHCHLNFFDDFKEDFSLFNLDIKKSNNKDIIQGVTTRLNKYWIKDIYPVRRSLNYD